MTFDAVFLSPHLDDVVLSCGGTIHRQAGSGRKVAVVTIFAGDLEDDPANRVQQEVYRRMSLDPAEAMTARRAEDLRACERVGADAVHWEFAEALGRHDDLPSLGALFEEPPESDDDLVSQLAEQMGAFDEIEEIVAPLGLGGHIDHRVVRRAAESAFGTRLRFYEDFPYVLQAGDVGRCREARSLGAQVRRLDPQDLSARVEAIEAYESQLGSLFGPGWRRFLPGKSVRSKVRRYVRAVGGERFWSAA